MSLYMQTTKISAARTAQEIASLLAQAGATAVLTEYSKDRKICGLAFRLLVGPNEVPFSLPARIEPVFKYLTEAGTPVHYNNFVNRVWNRCLDLAKVRRRSPHDLRHTWASQMLAAGADPAYVARQMGHANVATLLRVYAHYIPGSKRVGAEVLDENVKEKNGTQKTNESGS